jgi:hypothetical protein
MSAIRVPTFRWIYNPILVGCLAALGTAAIIGIPTDVIANPWFGRQTPAGTFDVVVLIVLSLLTGALAATFMVGRSTPGGRGAGLASGTLGWFAISCPGCNKLVVLLLGATGATGWFAPIQPILGIAAVLLASGALMIRIRLLRRGTCPVPVDS